MNKLKDLWYKIKQFCYWGWKLKDMYDFDATYDTYYLIYLKLNKAYKYFKDHGHLMWNENINTVGMRKLRICIELSKRLYDGDYTFYAENLYKKHEEKWGKLEVNFKDIESDNPHVGSAFIASRKNVITEEDKKQERKEYMRLIKKDKYLRDRDKQYLFKLLNKHLDGFWD